MEHEGIGIAAAVLVQGALAAVEQGEDAVEALLVLQRDLQTGPPQGMARQPEGKGQLLLVARDGPRGRGVPARTAHGGQHPAPVGVPAAPGQDDVGQFLLAMGGAPGFQVIQQGVGPRRAEAHLLCAGGGPAVQHQHGREGVLAAVQIGGACPGRGHGRISGFVGDVAGRAGRKAAQQ